MRLDIAKDIERTHPDMHFFAEERTLEMMERSKLLFLLYYHTNLYIFITNVYFIRLYLCIVLFIFAKLNPGIQYVQVVK